MDPIEYATRLYGVKASSCPFTREEIAELERTNELLVYVPGAMSTNEMCRHFGIKSNVDFEADRLVRYAMGGEAHWFIASASKTPELLNKSAVVAKRAFDDDGLHGMDVRRYLAFAATFRLKFDVFPDRTYWTFLLSGTYHQSGVSIIGFDAHGVLSHHGWMKEFKAKFVGSRYAVMAPRLELDEETASRPRAYRGGARSGRDVYMV